MQHQIHSAEPPPGRAMAGVFDVEHLVGDRPTVARAQGGQRGGVIHTGADSSDPLINTQEVTLPL